MHTFEMLQMDLIVVGNAILTCIILAAVMTLIGMKTKNPIIIVAVAIILFLILLLGALYGFEHIGWIEFQPVSNLTEVKNF